MTILEYNQLSADLRKLATEIPLRWGHIQNNRIDDKINMFAINSYAELIKAINYLNVDSQLYLKRRWYLWKCSQCDEFLFYHNGKSVHNPNRYDKEWDVMFNNDENLKFDIKGTVIPKNMRDDIESILNNPYDMIKFYFDMQSTGRRFDMQNRLFIVHHSFVDPSREFYLRCAWQSKEKIYDEYADALIGGKKTYSYKGCKSDVIFILEKEQNKVSYKY